MLTIENGQLVSAWGVEVEIENEVVFLDVVFVDGTCIEVFTGCDAQSDFFFEDDLHAILASQALLDQVFVDAMFALDTSPELTNGCESNSLCEVFTPIALPGEAISNETTDNGVAEIDDFVHLTFLQGSSIDTTDFDELVWAVWSESETVVSEPSALYLLLVGVVVLGWVQTRKRPTS